MRTNHLLVLDFETGSADPNADGCQILEIACLAVDFMRLEVVEGSEFTTLVRPENEDTLEAGAMNAHRIPLEQLRAAPPIRVAWAHFAAHVKGLATKSGTYHAPFPAGKNIRSFDLVLVEKMCRRFGPKSTSGEQTLLNPKWIFDVEDDLMRWFGTTNLLDSIAMDSVREFMGMEKGSAHRALFDVKQTAWLLCRFLNLYRGQCQKIRFKDSAKGVSFV